MAAAWRPTQAELGVAIGAPKQSICYWERSGVFEIRSAVARPIARTLRCRIKDLLAPPGAAPPWLDQSLWPRIRRGSSSMPAPSPANLRGVAADRGSESIQTLG
jgi:DNA-binding XRE family transcriptional regulator